MGVERLDLRIAQLITGEFLGTLVSLVDIYSYILSCFDHLIITHPQIANPWIATEGGL